MLSRVEGALNYLHTQNIKLGCVTNKRSRFTDKLLRSLKLYDLLGIVISGDSLSRKKPDPLPLLHAAKYFSISPQQGLMVGDSINDVEAARSAGMQVICVNYGYNLGRDIADAQPDVVIDSLETLPQLI